MLKVKSQKSKVKHSGQAPHLWSTSFFKTLFVRHCYFKKTLLGNSKHQIRKTTGCCCAPKVSGQAMLLTVLILAGSMLGASTIAGYLMLLKIRGASDITNSTRAIFAADTGVEWELYKQFKNPSYPKPSLSNNAVFETFTDGLKIKSIGESSNIFRAFELDYSGATTTLP